MLHASCSGFTLVEMLISIALFSFVMLATASVLLTVVDANRKSQGLKSVIDNLSLTIESIGRNLRTGSDYQCGGVGGRDCRTNPESILAFTNHTGQTVTYCFFNGAIRIGGSFCNASSDPMTAPEITIEHLNFYVDGTESTNEQPKVLITIGGVVNSRTAPGVKAKTSSRFDIETMVSQRLPDVAQN